MTLVMCGSCKVQGPPLNVIENAALVLPVVAGLLETILILYPVPEGTADGMVIVMEPLLPVDTNVPIVVGDEKLPAASESCAV